MVSEIEILRFLREQVAEITLGSIDPDSVVLESRLSEDLRLDSLDLSSLALALEDFAEISLLETNWRAVETVGDLVRAVNGSVI